MNKLLHNLKYGQVFSFENQNQRLPQRGHDSDYATNGRFIYLWPCDGTAPKVIHMENGQEVIFATEVYYQPVTELTIYIS